MDDEDELDAVYGRRFGRSDLDRCGVFGDMGFLRGKWRPPVQGPKVRDEKGFQMMSCAPKIKTGLADCYFEKDFKRTFVREGWTTEFTRRLKAEKKAAIKQLGGPYVPPKPTEKIHSVGHYSGTFRGQVPSFSPQKREPKKKILLQDLPNFYTKPGKKGGSGYMDITIGPYPKTQKRDKYYDVKKPKKIPFLGEDIRSGQPGRYFGPDPYFVLEPESTYNKLKEVEWDAYGVFTPNSPTKSGTSGCFEKWPIHYDEKWIPKHKIEYTLQELIYKRRGQRPAFVSPPARLLGPSRAFYTCSIITKNARTAVTKKNWKKAKPVTYTREFLH